MASHTVQAPDGRTWVVRRRWVPRFGNETVWGRFHRRFRRAMNRFGKAADADPGCLDLIGEGIVVAITVVVGLLIVLLVILPLLVAVVDLVVVLLLALLALLARVVFRRPWTVDATASDGTRLTARVVGWRASGERAAEIGELLGAGITPPDAIADGVVPRRPVL